MRNVLVSTSNVQRFFDAARALEKRLTDDEIVGMGLVYGSPGLGKTMAMRAYHARHRKSGRVRTVLVRALAHWTEASMLKALVQKIGQEPRGYRKDLMFDQLEESLRGNPAVILIDEIDAIAGSRTKMAILKDVHDVTGSAILMVGEQRVDGLLRRFESFYNRMNLAALHHLSSHTEADVAAVVVQRCEVEVAAEVCAQIHTETGGRSMRSVLDRIREMEAQAQVNGWRSIGVPEYRQVFSRGQIATMRSPSPELEVANA